MKYYLMRVAVILFLVGTVCTAVSIMKNRQPVNPADVFLPDSEFEGQLKDIAPMTLSPQVCALDIELILPQGQKFNTKAPFYLKTFSENEEVVKFRTPSQPELKRFISVPVGVGAGTTVVRIDLNFSYCDYENESICYFDVVRLIVPVAVEAGGSDSFDIIYQAGN
jgi:hypothetical protein